MTTPQLEEAVFRVFPILETERLILRQITMADRGAIYRIYSDADVTRYNIYLKFDTISDAERFIIRVQQDYEKRLAIRWGITLKNHGTVIGTCGYFNWSQTGLFAHSASIGYEVARNFWRKGYGYEALCAILNFGFGFMQLNRIEADMLVDNTPAVKLLEKLGFELEGILRERGFWQGRFHNLKHFSLLRRDWRDQK